MKAYTRVSPVSFEAAPAATEMREGWGVVLAYEKERDRYGLVDLSHWPKWDIQDTSLSQIELSDIRFPHRPGEVVIRNNCIVNRMNATQAAIWQYRGQTHRWSNLRALTDVTDAFALIALFGSETGRIMEKVTALDLAQPGKDTPFLLQGPVLHVPMQVVAMRKGSDLHGVLMAFARGYGQTVVDALLYAGEEFDLRPAGESRFTAWFESVFTPPGT
jgi:glycine cleavage system aminomethyltransferase T